MKSTTAQLEPGAKLAHYDFREQLGESVQSWCEIPMSPYLSVHPLYLRVIEEKGRRGLNGIRGGVPVGLRW